MAKKKFTTTIDEDLLWRAKIQAATEKRSVSDLLEELLKNYLAKNQSNDTPPQK